MGMSSVCFRGLNTLLHILSGVAFIHAFDETAGQGKLDAGIFTGQSHETLAGETAFKGPCSRQLLPHQDHGPVLHGPFVVEVNDPAGFLLPDAPRSSVMPASA